MTTVHLIKFIFSGEGTGEASQCSKYRSTEERNESKRAEQVGISGTEREDTATQDRSCSEYKGNRGGTQGRSEEAGRVIDSRF